MKYIIDLAAALLSLQNFNSLMAILSGIQNDAVYRLKHTFDQLPKKSVAKLEAMRKLMDSSCSFECYRKKYATVKAPCIPYLGIYQSSLKAIEDVHESDFRGLVNFWKCTLIYHQVEEALRFCESPYNLAVVPRMKLLLDRLPVLTDEDLYRYSFKHEPMDKKER